MESYGALLKSAREEKNISLEQIEQDTSISKDFLLALENEETGIFHGEAYTVGFLRNYADYLDLDSKKIISLYHNMMIQEAPVPEGLFETPKSSLLKPIIIASSILLITAVIFVVYFFGYRQKQIEKQNAAAISEKVQTRR